MRCRALLVLALCWVPLARANLLPNLYLFSERPPPVPLALGSVLYYFYQDDYPATLQEALYVEHRFGTNVPGRDLLLLAKGSAALGLGMLNQARIWLAEVDTKRLPPNALPRLHLAMARVAFLDGDDVLCGQYLNELSPELDARPDVNYLRVELARRAHDLRAMATSLARLPEETPFWFFGWHNYAVTARELHELDTAASAFDRVASARPRDELGRDIVVRAALEGAMLRFQQSDVAGATRRLDAIPVTGSYGRMALAQRANLAMAADDYHTAARVFANLAGNQADRWDSHRVDALIGVAFAMERTSGGAAALDRYNDASAQLSDRLQGLNGLDTGLADRAWLELLADVSHGTAVTDTTRLKEMDGKFSGVDWLAWLSDRDTQRHLAGWRRLSAMTKRIAVLRESAAALGEAAVEQERRVASANERLQGDAVVNKMQQQLATLDAMDARLQALRAPSSSLDDAAFKSRIAALATKEEASQLANLERMRLLATRTDKPELLKRIARLQGVVSWNVADEAAARIWAQEKVRRALAGKVDALSSRAARITTAETERAAQVGAAAKVASFGTDLLAIADRTEILTNERAQALTDRLRERIRKDRDDTRKQLTYAQLAVARITDQALTSGRSAP